MNKTKLTLSIKPDLVKSAKTTAKEMNLSVSELIERYLSRITQEKQVTSPKVSQWFNKHIPKFSGTKKQLDDLKHTYLEEKYLQK